MEYEYTVLNPRHNIEYVKHENQPCLHNNAGGWWCAYVTLDNITREEYPNETYRDGNIVGVDTNHTYNMNQNMDERFEDAKMQITQVIEAHEKRMKEIEGIFKFKEFMSKHGTKAISKMIKDKYKSEEGCEIADELEEMLIKLNAAMWADPGKYYFGNKR